LALDYFTTLSVLLSTFCPKKFNVFLHPVYVNPKVVFKYVRFKRTVLRPILLLVIIYTFCYF
jgi:hypothetical protein